MDLYIWTWLFVDNAVSLSLDLFLSFFLFISKMTTIMLLPHDILVHIFDQIDSVAQLAICRSVCQKWNSPVEVAMFGKKISIKTEDHVIQLYGHLCKDPSKGKLIKHLDFQIEDYHLPLIYKHLLRLAFTTNIEYLTGTVRAPSFYTTLTEVAGNTCSQFTRIKMLPSGISSHSFHIVDDFLAKFNSTRMCLVTKSPLQDLYYDSLDNSIVERAYALRYVLFDNCFTGGWQELELSLKYCPKLKALACVHFTQERRRMTRVEVHSWIITANVSKVLSLETIWLKTVELCPELLEYLMFKYPNVQVIRLRSMSSSAQWNVLCRVLNAIKDVKQKDLTFWLPANVAVDNMKQFAASRSEAIRFQKETFQGELKMVMKIKTEPF